MKRNDGQPPRRRHKNKQGHAPTDRQREALAHPAGLRPRNEHFHDASVADAGAREAAQRKRAEERPAWMSDASLLPRRPPGRSKEA